MSNKLKKTSLDNCNMLSLITTNSIMHSTILLTSSSTLSLHISSIARTDNSFIIHYLPISSSLQLDVAHSTTLDSDSFEQMK